MRVHVANNNGLDKLAQFLCAKTPTEQEKLAAAMQERSVTELEAILRAEGLAKTASDDAVGNLEDGDDLKRRAPKHKAHFDANAGASTDRERAEAYSNTGAILGGLFGRGTGVKSALTGYGAGRLVHRAVHGPVTGKKLEKKSSLSPNLFAMAHSAGVKLAHQERLLKVAAIKSLVTHWEITPEGDTVEGLDDVVQYLIGKGPMPQESHLQKVAAGLEAIAKKGLQAAGNAVPHALTAASKGVGKIMGNTSTRNAAVGAAGGAALGAAQGAASPNGSMVGGALKGGLAGGAAGFGAKSALRATGGMNNAAGSLVRGAGVRV